VFVLDSHHHHSYSAVRHISQGYALVILGMTASLFLYAGALGEWPVRWWIMIHAVSIALIVAGAWWWWHMPPLTANWLRATEQFWLAALLQAYMIPFVVWWKRAPGVPFLTVNVIATLAGLAWLLMMLAAVIAETGRILGDRTMNMEGRICMWLGPPLLLIPLCYAMISSLTFFIRAGFPLEWDSVRVGLLWPSWTATVMLFSPVLLLSVAVETRLRCLRSARWLQQNPPGSTTHSSAPD
jgi:hypothetical protein